MKKFHSLTASPLHRFTAFVLLLLLTLNSVFAQVNPIDECKSPVVWTGGEIQPFCSKIGPNPPSGSCAISLGTTLHHSSQLASNTLSGTVCISGGSFSITANTEFTFQNATVYIAPNVAIIVEAGAILNLDNASLHGCDGLWQGIRLLEGSQIHTDNNTLIEDASLAISARFVSAALEIINTTFNRNVTGIWLEQTPFASNPPFISRLENAIFKCDGPIIGSNDISTYGIYAHNIPFVFNISPDVDVAPNLFQGLKYGIKIDGKSTFLKCNRFWFREIYYSSIEIEKGELDIKNSLFVDYGDDGIKINGLHKLKAQSCTFQVAEISPHYLPAPSGTRTAVNLSSSADISYPFEVNVDVSGSIFTYGCPTVVGEQYSGIRIALPFVKRKVLIRSDNAFGVEGLNAHGISLYGSLNESSKESYEIYANQFEITAPNTQASSSTSGILVGGLVNNLHIVDNYFSGNTASLPQALSNDLGILFQNVVGQNNKIIGNRFAGDFFAGLQLNYSPNVRICSNSALFSRGFYFIGDNPGTDFNRNVITVGELAIQGVIGTQIQKDNRFQSILFFGTRASCLSGNCALLSRFEVRQPIGTEYYPTVQTCGINGNDCDDNSKFIVNQLGQESTGCADETPDPGDVGMMLAIAQNNIPDVNEYPFKRFYYESWLYRKLMEDVVLTGSNPAFVSFLQTKANSTVGQFVNVENLIQAAMSNTVGYASQLQGFETSLDSLELQIGVVDQLLQTTCTNSLIQSKNALMTAWQTVVQQLELLSALRAAQIGNALQSAIAANSAIVATTNFESNQKALNVILFDLFFQGSMILPPAQKATLTTIAGQCLLQNGNAVSQSAGLLTGCAQQPVNLLEQCGIELQAPSVMPAVNDRSFRNDLVKAGIQTYVNGDELYIVLPPNFEGQLVIVDINGREVYAQKVTNDESLVRVDIRGLTNGILFVSARNQFEMHTMKVGIFR